MYEQVLKQAGLTADEIKVYELLLKEGELPAHSVITGTQLKRGTAYNVLRNLKGKGLLEEFEKHKKSYFRLEPPSRLRDYLETQKRRLEESASMLEGVLPQLVSQYSLVLGKPGVRFYEGFEGIKEVHRQILAEGKEILAYVFIDEEIEKPLDDFWRWYFKERKKKQIYVRAIAADNQAGVNYKSRDEQELRQTKLVPQAQFPLTIEKNICGHKLALISMREKIATVIESAEIAATERSIFELAWNSLLP